MRKLFENEILFFLEKKQIFNRGINIFYCLVIRVGDVIPKWCKNAVNHLSLKIAALSLKIVILTKK